MYLQDIKTYHIQKFFAFASSYIHINVLKLAITTGCRIGEVLGLKWEDCDFEKRQIVINKTIHYSKVASPIEGAKFFYTTAKTPTSNRVIPMTDEVYQILQNRKLRQTEYKMLKRTIWKQHKEFQNLVFTGTDGSPVYYFYRGYARQASKLVRELVSTAEGRNFQQI